MGAGSLRCGNRRLDQGQCPRVLNQIRTDRIAEHVAEDREEMAVLLNQATGNHKLTNAYIKL